jgi:hypothetical protein
MNNSRHNGTGYWMLPLHITAADQRAKSWCPHLHSISFKSNIHQFSKTVQKIASAHTRFYAICDIQASKNKIFSNHFLTLPPIFTNTDISL